EIEVEIGQRVVLDGARAFTQRLELGQRLGGLGALVDEAGAHVAQRLPQLLVGERLVCVFLEGGGGDQHGYLPPIGAVSVMPASTSATWRTSVAAPCRFSLPAMFIRQPRSPASSMSALEVAMLAVFFSTISLEISEYLTQNVPPKPQHTSASGISFSASPSTEASNARGWLRTPSSRRPEQESW